MHSTTFTLQRGEVALFVYRWLPDPATAVRGIVQVVHGMAEHGARYAPLAEALTAMGFAVYASDLRGHGRTAGDPSRRGHFADDNGWRVVLDDLGAVAARAREEHPTAPYALFGHSMGSFFVQQMLFECGDSLCGAVVSGSSSGVSNPLAPIGRVIARAERWRLGRRAPSPLLTKMSFGAFNDAFKPARTRYDWLSRDSAQVDAYLADAWCGFEVSTQLWIDLLDALPGLAAPQNLARIPKDLPIYVLAGSADPVTGHLKGLQRLVAEWSRAGVRDITWRVYDGGRHEMLNETNRSEVLSDLVRWFERIVAKKNGATP